MASQTSLPKRREKEDQGEPIQLQEGIPKAKDPIFDLILTVRQEEAWGVLFPARFHGRKPGKVPTYLSQKAESHLHSYYQPPALDNLTLDSLLSFSVLVPLSVKQTKKCPHNQVLQRTKYEHELRELRVSLA